MSDHTLQEQQESQHRALGYQPVHIVTFTYGHYFNLD